jgi:plastocyanin
MRQRFGQHRSWAIGLALALSVLCLMALAVGAHASGAGAVKIADFAFGPQTTTVAAGTTVVWTNADDDAHSIVADAGAFRSKALDTDDKSSFTFAKAGEYSYHCGLHLGMIGKIIVK